MPVQYLLVSAAGPHRPARLTRHVRGNRGRPDPGVPREAEQQSRLVGEQARGPGGIRGRLQEGDELLGRIGRRGRIVDRDEINPPAGPCLERDHEPQEIRIGLRVRTPEAGRHPADADEVRTGRVELLEDTQPGESGRQRSLEREEDLPTCELLLMRSSIRARQLTVIGDELVLDARDLGDQRLEHARLFGGRVEDDRHTPSVSSGHVVRGL